MPPARLLLCLALCLLESRVRGQLTATEPAGIATQPPPTPLNPSFSIIAGPPVPPAVQEEIPPCPSSFRATVCQQAEFHSVDFNSIGCPLVLCKPCGLNSGHRSECRGQSCPPLEPPIGWQGRCPPGQFLGDLADSGSSGCSSLACLPCTPALMGLRNGCRCPPQQPGSQPAACPAGQFLRRFNDSLGCQQAACEACPLVSVPVCPAGQFARSYSSPHTGCGLAGCADCTADSADQPGCRPVVVGCTEANKPACPPGRQPAQQLLGGGGSVGGTCHWTCQACPNVTRPSACPPGQFIEENPAGHCLPWSCRDCDFKHRDLPSCRPAETCPSRPDWAIACAAGQFRRAAASPVSGCLTVECASCQQAAKDAANSSPSESDSAAASGLPAECRRPCPEPLVLCDPGSTVEFGLDADGCRTATCRPCRDQEACAAGTACSHRGRLDFDAADCQPGLFHLADISIDGCAARVCLPCPATGLAPSGCRELPAACSTSALAASVGSNALPNCSAGSQQVQQMVDSHGCPSLACADCPAQQPVCPAGHHESPRPTKWLRCQQFDCRQVVLPQAASRNDTTSVASFFGSSSVSSSSSSSFVSSSSSSASSSLFSSSSSAAAADSSPIPTDAAGCPVQPWLQSPVEFGSEWLQLDGGCRLRRYRVCPPPSVSCRRGELPLLTEGCQYNCQQRNWTSASAACFPGRQYIVFVVDSNRAKSPFQIRFQVASFIARLASQLSYGPNAVQIGAICYSGRILSVISPDDCPTVDSFFRQLLLLRYDEDSSTATGEAVAAAAALFAKLRRPDARRSVVLITDSVTNSGRSLQSASTLLPAGTEKYFVSLSSVWNPALRTEAAGFVSETGHLAELNSYYLLSTSGVQQLLPQCYRACDSARNSLSVRQSFLSHLQDSVHQYEAWLYSVYTSISQLQDSLETMQYQFENKQIRLELCSRMVAHYKAAVLRLQDQLDSLQAMRSQAVSAADYETDLAQVRQLEQQVQSLTVKKSQLVSQLQETLIRIGSAEDSLASMRREQEAKVAAESSQIAALEARTAQAWQSLQTLTQELLLKRMSASNAEAMVQEKEARIQDVLLINTDMAARIATLRTQIEGLKASTNGSQVTRFISTKQALSSCQSIAALDGFSPLLTIKAGSGVRLQEVTDALKRGTAYSWMKSDQSAEMLLFASLRNFTVGAYSQVKLLFRSSAGESKAHLTFQTAAFDLTSFFDSTNLIASFPWRLEYVKETLDLSWSLRSDRFPSLLFSILTQSAASGSQCAGRAGLLAVLTDRDGCEDLPGPYPRLRFSPSGRPAALAEMEDLDSLQLLVKPLAADAGGWLTGLVATVGMPMTLSELLSNGMLAYPAEAAPAGPLRPGLFYKSLLLRSRPVAFPLVRLRLTAAASGQTHQLVYNGSFDRDRLVQSSWNRRLLTSARLFAADSPFAFVIGDAAPCQAANASGVLYFNLDNACPAVADARNGWSVLMSPAPDQMTDWSRAQRADFVEISLRRMDVLPGAAAAASAVASAAASAATMMGSSVTSGSTSGS